LESVVTGKMRRSKTAVRAYFADKEPEYFLKGLELLVHRCESVFK
jgi:hypothetical protein